MQMNIGFDLDGVLIGKPPFIPKKILERLYKKNSPKLSYRMPSRIEQLVRAFSHKKLFRPPLERNIKVLRKFKKYPYSFFLISGRFGFIKKETESIIQNHQLHVLFKKRFFNYNNIQPHIHKRNILKDLQLHKYVDDDLDLLAYLSKIYTKTIFFWLNEEENKKISKNLYSITDLYDIFKGKKL